MFSPFKIDYRRDFPRGLNWQISVFRETIPESSIPMENIAPHRTFVSQALKPDRSFDPVAMAHGEPGVPESFRWGKRDLVVAEILERVKEYADCRHGSGDRYSRKHD